MLYNLWRGMAMACFVAAIPSSLFAVDGVTLIDQSHALAGGVTPGDTPGFPVTISQPGSYRLSSNLTVTGLNTTAIVITVDAVTLDLNGFSISGPAVCLEFPLSCVAAGTGAGVQATGANGLPGPTAVRVMNGAIRGMGGRGINLLGEGSIVEKVTASGNAGGGMLVNGFVADSTAALNGAFGIFAITVRGSIARENVTDGIILDASGGVGIANVSSFNGGRGILAPNAVVTGNTIVRNGAVGIQATCPSTISGNLIVGDAAGTIQTELPGCVLDNNSTRP